ncbi:helix-turn-helix domain-containing protein, partial [Streptomyces sp. NPDC094468]|uniref:helix-turn-helix domain-containing protein n=1 Tax=Streptomyces sp. NPDC094468 TaxID=3366066 RepID=UPI0038159603
MASEEELFASVDALLNEEPSLPPPAERARLREAAGITQARLATALKTTTQSVKNWENGRSEPKPPRLDAYQRLLNGWAAKYPAPGAALVARTAPTVSGEPVASAVERADAPQAPAMAAAAPVRSATPRPAAAAARRLAAQRVAQPAADPRFPHGPLAVLDGDGCAYCTGGIVLDCPATTVVELVEWTLRESGLGAAKL